jgi:hypothetical protein
MAYRLDWKVRVSWVPGGVGLGQQAYGPIGVEGGPAQSIDFFGSNTSTTLPNSTTFNPADITTLLTTLTNDCSAQMNVAATIARIQNFSTGTG